MRVLIFRSQQGEAPKAADPDYLQAFDTRYAERVIGNLRGDPGFCAVCESDCINCRRAYDRRYGDQIAGVVDLPAVLPYVLENPRAYLPDTVPAHDVILAIHIHEQVLLEILKACSDWGTRGVVAPLESADWISGSTRGAGAKVCEAYGIEIAFPKPFCAFRPPAGTVLDDFRSAFHIGYPEVDVTIEDEKVTGTRVNVSAACGATYYIARGLEGRSVADNLEIEVVAKRFSSYPCTASMQRDPELHDDTPMHVAGEAHYAILGPLRKGTPSPQDEMMRSPMGAMIHKPIPAKENLENIDAARAAILREIDKDEMVTLADLREKTGSSPAAINSALLLLKGEGLVQVTGRTTVTRI